MKTIYTLLHLLTASPAMAEDNYIQPSYQLDAPIISNEEHFPSLVPEKTFSSNFDYGKFRLNGTAYNIPLDESATFELGYTFNGFQGTLLTNIPLREPIFHPGFMLETTLIPNINLSLGLIQKEETQYFTGIKIKF